MRKRHLALVRPNTENVTVKARRPKNAELRTREHLATHEVEALIATAKGIRHGQRDALMILLTFRHGLRAAEVVDLRWEQVDFKTATLHVRRVKNGTPSAPSSDRRKCGSCASITARVRRRPPCFVSERGAPFSAPGFSRMVERTGVEANLGIRVHAHMLRHATGYKLAADGHDTRSLQAYLGHRNIQNTVRYTALSPTRFKNFGETNDGD